MSYRPNIELLSPAGDRECLDFAFTYGADAVYIGAKEFGMRSSCANFSIEEMQNACSYAHGLGKRVFLTLNTVPTNEEIAAMPHLIKDAASAGIDAFIIADLGVLSLAKKHAPDVEIHFSIQAGIANYESANMAYKLGAKRVVLARELSLEDIEEIRSKIPEELELEVFVHGAMCMSVSGRCLLSQYLTGRDANRGKCAQSCRWKYSLVEEKRPGEYFEIGEDEFGSYILNADDLCTAHFLDKIVKAGVSSLKIEGRAKSFYYVASTTAAYRAALNEVLKGKENGTYNYPEFTKEEIYKISHRNYSDGFYFGKQGATNSAGESGYIRDWQLLAVVEKQENGLVHAVQRGKFELGDELEILTPEGKTYQIKPEKIYGENNEEIKSTPHTKMKFSVKAPDNANIPPKSIIRMKL